MTGIIATLNDIATTWGALIWQASWQGGIALLLALLACRCLREGSASLKCWLWRLAFCKLLIAGLWFGSIPLRLLPTPPTTPPESSATPQFAANTKESMARFDGGESWSPVVLPSTSPGPRFHASPKRVERIEPIVWLLLAWSVGVAICFANLVKHWIQLRRMLARCSPLVNGPAVDCLVECCRRMHLRRRPRLFMSDGVEGPFLVGMFRPAIVLPAIVARETSGNGLPVALFHELAHIKRHDLWWNWLFALAEGIFFFHPLVWWTRREWCVAREIAADEWAIRTSRMSAAQYGRSLLELVARFPARRRSACLTIGVSEAYSQLSRRMIAMKAFQKRSARRRIGLAAVLVGVAVVGLVPWKLAAREPVVATTPAEAKEERSGADRVGDDRDGGSNTVRGVVKDESGAPVSGATVLVGLYGRNGPQRQILRTDEDGRFETPFTYDEHPLVIAYKDGLTLASHWVGRVGKEREQEIAPLTLTLGEPVPFVGRVQDADGDPIPGASARVEIFTTTDPEKYDWNHLIEMVIEGSELDPLVTATTDENGEFRFAAIPADAQSSLKVSADGMATLRTMTFFDKPLGERFYKGTAEDPTVLTLQPEGIIEGRIVTELEGVNVAGLTVEAQASNNSAVHIEPYSRTTDAAGRFRFDGLAAGTVNVFLTDHPPDGPWTYYAARDVRIKPGERSEVTIELIERYIVEGKVIDTDGDPVAGVSVGVYAPSRPESGGAILSYKTEKNGIYRFHLPRGSARIYISSGPPGYAPPGYTRRESKVIAIPVGKGTIEGPTLVFGTDKGVSSESRKSGNHQSTNDKKSGRTIVIHIVDEKGKPIQDAMVFRNHVYRQKGSDKPEIENEHYRTNANGTAVVSLSGTSIDLRLWVSKKNFVPLHAMWAKQFQADGDQIPKEFTFQLQHGTEIGGVVRDELGQPIQGVKVEIQNLTAVTPVLVNSDEKPGVRPVPVTWLAEEDSAAVTDAQGRWTLGNVPPNEDLQFDPRIAPGMFITGEFGAPTEAENEQVKSHRLRVYFSHPDYVSDGVRRGDNTIQRSQNITLEDLRAGTAVAVMKRLNR